MLGKRSGSGGGAHPRTIISIYVRALLAALIAICGSVTRSQAPEPHSELEFSAMLLEGIVEE
jgi:hypothetical protein